MCPVASNENPIAKSRLIFRKTFYREVADNTILFAKILRYCCRHAGPAGLRNMAEQYRPIRIPTAYCTPNSPLRAHKDPLLQRRRKGAGIAPQRCMMLRRCWCRPPRQAVENSPPPSTTANHYLGLASVGFVGLMLVISRIVTLKTENNANNEVNSRSDI